MDSIFEKLFFISKLNNFNNHLIDYVKLVSKVNTNYKVNEKISNCMKISVEFNAFDVNKDKQRKCYKQLKCFWPKCRYSCDRESELNIHISHHLNKRKFVCEECNKQFHQNSHLFHHKRCVHSNDRPFVCNQNNCNKTFKTKSDLTKHSKRHSLVKNFGCDECVKKFKTNSELCIHKKFVHLNNRPFVCPQNNCNQRFKLKSDLNRHKRIHCSDKPFECEECYKRFKFKSILISHKLFHSNVKKYKCNINDCKKEFRQRSSLYDHKKRFHSGIKRHKCLHKNCEKSFFTSLELKQHIGYKHSTDRPYKCNLHNCNSSFKSSANFYKHKNKVH